jgi:hypothetical protein
MLMNILQVLIKQTDTICTHALAGFLHILSSLAYETTFKESGIEQGNKGTLRCIEPYGGILLEIEKKEV